MGYVEVHGADLAGDRIEKLRVKIPRLPARTIDRETAVKWMKDGHSFVPVVGGRREPALQLLELPGDEATFVIRADHAMEPADSVPPLPPTSSAAV